MRTPRLLSATALLGAALASGAHAAATITFDSAPPSDPGGFALFCDVADPDPDGYPWTHGTGTSLGVGQTFTLDQAVLLDKLTVRLRQESGLAGEGVSLTFFEIDGAVWEALDVENGLVPFDLPIGENVYVTFDFPDRIFAAGVSYAFLLRISGGGNVSDASATVFHVEDDECVGGGAFQTGGAATVPLPDDLVFYLHSADQVTDSTLSLRDGRFAVTVDWRDFEDRTGRGEPVALTDESGYFWFFNRENVEVVIKVLDACALNQRYWVFAAGLTNVETEIEVLDLDSGATWSSSNPLGQTFETVLDTDAFETCP